MSRASSRSRNQLRPISTEHKTLTFNHYVNLGFKPKTYNDMLRYDRMTDPQFQSSVLWLPTKLTVHHISKKVRQPRSLVLLTIGKQDPITLGAFNSPEAAQAAIIKAKLLLA